MIKRDELVKFIYKTIGSDLLEKAEDKDNMANGVQIMGAEQVEVVTLGVSLNEEFLKKAVSDKSNFCIFHHGFDFETYKHRLMKSQDKRLRLIYKNDITVVGLHYTLDAHEKIGNNAQIIEKLSGKISDTLFDEWGYVATLSKPLAVETLEEKCEELFGRAIYAVKAGAEVIKTIGVVSGAGKPAENYLYEMQQKNVQLYISGETSEWYIHRMKEAGIHYFVCGHYSTEVFGVKALGEKIRKEFKDDIVVEFIDVPNPI